MYMYVFEHYVISALTICGIFRCHKLEHVHVYHVHFVYMYMRHLLSCYVTVRDAVCSSRNYTDHKLLAAGHSGFKAISVPAAVFLQLSKQSNE